MDIKDFKIIHPKDILVKVFAPNEVTSGTGIVLDLKPSMIQDRDIKGEVLQVGTQITDIKIGDIIYFEKTAGVDLLPDNGYKYMLLHYDRVIGILK